MSDLDKLTDIGNYLISEEGGDMLFMGGVNIPEARDELSALRSNEARLAEALERNANLVAEITQLKECHQKVLTEYGNLEDDWSELDAEVERLKEAVSMAEHIIKNVEPKYFSVRLWLKKYAPQPPEDAE